MLLSLHSQRKIQGVDQLHPLNHVQDQGLPLRPDQNLALVLDRARVRHVIRQNQDLGRNHVLSQDLEVALNQVLGKVFS